eukprot:113660_1
MSLFAFIRISCVFCLFLPLLMWFTAVGITKIVIPKVLRALILDRMLELSFEFVFRRIPLFGRIYQTFDSLNILSYLIQRAYGKGTFHYPSPDKMHPVQDTDTVLDTLKYPLWHAMTIYPPWYLSLLGIRFPIRQSTKDLTSQWFQLKPDDWIDHYGFIDQRYSWLNLCVPCRGINPIYHPSYYLIKDDATKTYVLSIRGSTTTTDWRGDGIGASVDFMIGDVILGKAHKGILRSAQNVYGQVLDKLQSIPDEYQLVITGHSLGAGVAAMVGLLLLFTQGNDRLCSKLTVYAFGPPPIVSQNIGESELAQKHIKSILLNTDIVTRMGAQQLKKYQRSFSTSSAIDASSFDCLLPAGQIYWFIPKDLKQAKSGYNLKAFVGMWDTARYQMEQWKVCDMSSNRDVYDELSFDGFESVYAHHVYRYAWAVGIDISLKPNDIRAIQKSACYVTESKDDVRHVLPMDAKTATLVMGCVSEPAMLRVPTDVIQSIQHFQPIPRPSKSLTPTTPALLDFECNLDVIRIAKTADNVIGLKGPHEIQAMVSAQYTLKEDQEDMKTDEESSYDDGEREEIERMKDRIGVLQKTKSEKLIASTGKLLRPKTETAWEEDDLNEAETGMRKQLESMTRVSVDGKDWKKAMEDEKDLGPDSENEFEADEDEGEDEFIPNSQDIETLLADNPDPQLSKGKRLEVQAKRGSQLFRLKSKGKWDTDQLRQENEDMQAQLTSLLMNAKAPTGNKPL